MIHDDQQDQAALYALGLLDEQDAAAMEASFATNDEARQLASELQEVAALFALSAPAKVPSRGLKNRILQKIERDRAKPAPVTAAVGFPSWVPWAIAALFLFFCGFLVSERMRLQRNLARVQSIDPLSHVDFFALAATPDGPADARAVVAWASGRQSGVIRISKLPPPAAGKDYQLWAVDSDHKDPVSAGIVKVDAAGGAEVPFKTVSGTSKVKLFAISLEQAGGSATKEGPILLAGK